MTTHYQKIQALGNRMAENLTIMGVPSQFDEGGLTLADKILEISSRITSGIILYADKKIGQSGDEIKFTAVYIEDGKTVSGKEILFDGADTTGISRSIPASVDTSVGNKYAITAIPSTNSFLDKDHYILIYRDNYPKCTVVYKNIRYSGSNFIMDNGVIKYTDNNDVQQTIDVSDCDTSVVYTTGNGFTITDYSESITNDYGVATATYTCNGSGLREVSATSGTFVSETLSVWDTLYHDEATISQHNDNVWYALSSVVTMEREADGTVVTSLSAWGGASIGSTSQAIMIPKDSVVEFDLISFDTTGIIQMRSGVQQSGNWVYCEPTKYAGHQKWEIGSNQQKAYVDGVLKQTLNQNLGDTFRFTILGSTANSKVKFANLKIYPL